MVTTVMYGHSAVDTVHQSLLGARAGHVVHEDRSCPLAIVGPTHWYCSYRHEREREGDGGREGERYRSYERVNNLKFFLCATTIYIKIYFSCVYSTR